MLERKWGVVRNIREEEGTGKVGEELELLLGRRASMQPRQSCNIGALLFGPMVLSLGLLLHAQQAVSQELCEAPGHLPAPSIFLSPTAARMGETVQLQCTVDTSGHISRIIFCHNGQEASAMKGEKKSIYNHYESVSAASSGNYSCGYEIRDIMNRVTRSQFSPVQHLHIQGDKPEGTHTAAGPSEEPTLAGQRFVLSLGISVPCILLLAALGCLIIRKEVPGFWTKRGQSKQEDTPEDEVQYASITVARTSKPACPPEDTTSTYAAIAPRRNQYH
ncbi:uncharacterized protein [Struthio camelus]|uniref:uncharacterized protein isoform X3 n=1 Tax=Struthio camelus TaxID=8801 RepID=UPI003603F3BD